ncbi:MAG TPA: hypothetical protein PK800_06225, partial [Syntrophorhabdaceae bacterium]|nr:hypothetical protein [Syntrophorhabdaceae bacterium]
MEQEKLIRAYPSALEVNLKRTAVPVEIPERFSILLDISKEHFGLSRQTEELLKELNHPYVNWEYCLKVLKTISIGDFYAFNNHKQGADAIKTILEIYLEVIKRCPKEGIKETAARYIFEYLHIIITESGVYRERNIPLLNYAIEAIYNIAESEDNVFKKTTGSLKILLKTILEENIELSTPYFKRLVEKV